MESLNFIFDDMFSYARVSCESEGKNNISEI